MQTKTCPVCGQAKPLAEYHAKSSRTTGAQGYCKDCNREYQRTYMRRFMRARRRRLKAERIAQAAAALRSSGVL